MGLERHCPIVSRRQLLQSEDQDAVFSKITLDILKGETHQDRHAQRPSK